MKRTSLHFLWKDRSAAEGFRSAVSLHGHTHHSWENLRFLHTFKLPLPLIPAALRLAGWHHRRATGRKMELDRVLWTPPLAPREAHAVEAGQIRSLGPEPIVSLTDHDDIEGALAARRRFPERAAPISLEWTIPFGPTFFHLGIHNLPAGTARGMTADMYRYTAHPEPARLGELLETLHEREDILVVLNHPLWDEAGIGAEHHRAAVAALVLRHGKWIHALELNGLRSREENQETLELARVSKLPAISGGDRLSRVLFMPQYREPLRLRWFETVKDIVRCHPGIERRRWVDRFFYECEDGVRRPLAELWPNEGPALLRSFFAMLRLSESHSLRAALRLAIADPAEMQPWPAPRHVPL